MLDAPYRLDIFHAWFVPQYRHILVGAAARTMWISHIWEKMQNKANDTQGRILIRFFPPTPNT